MEIDIKAKKNTTKATAETNQEHQIGSRERQREVKRNEMKVPQQDKKR